MKLSLLTFNTLGTPLFAPDITKRYKKLAELIGKSNTTFVCLQEVTTYYHLFLIKRTLKNYPHIGYQKFLYGPKGGLVIFSKLPLAKSTYKEFSSLGKLTDISFYTRLLRNGILICQVKDPKITLITTHLTCDFTFNYSPTNKLYNHVKEQVMEVIAQVNSLEKKQESFILCGDFNIQKSSRLYNLLLGKTKLVDAFAKSESPTYSPHRVPYKFPAEKEAQIDFCFYYSKKPKLSITEQHYHFKKTEQITKKRQGFLSDHIGLGITFDTLTNE